MAKAQAASTKSGMIASTPNIRASNLSARNRASRRCDARVRYGLRTGSRIRISAPSSRRSSTRPGKRGWSVISIKDDRSRIFADGVADPRVTNCPPTEAAGRGS